jgi:hypothetical protein
MGCLLSPAQAGNDHNDENEKKNGLIECSGKVKLRTIYAYWQPPRSLQDCGQTDRCPKTQRSAPVMRRKHPAATRPRSNSLTETSQATHSDI